MYKFILTLFLFSAVHLSAQTSEKWSLQQCVDYALEHNTSIQQNELQGEILTNNLNQAKLSRIPTLSGSGNHNYNIGRTIDPFTNTFNNTTIQSNSFSLSSGVLLYGGSQVNNRIKQSAVATEANSKSTEVIRNQIALSVATTYLQIVQAEENLKVAIQQERLADSQLERALLLEKSGAANQSNTLLLKAQAASDRVAIVNAENAIQIAYNTLINLMQLPLNESVEIALIDIATLPDAPTENVASVYQLALNNLPEIQQAELQIRQSELGEKIAGAGLQPTLSAYGNVNTVYSQSGKDVSVTGDFTTVPIGFTENSLEPVLQPQPVTIISDKAFGKQLTDNLGQQVGVSLSVPIFNGYRNRTALENAKVNTKISELTLENTKNQLRNDVTTAYTNLKAAKSRYDAALLNVEAQELSFAFSQKRFDAGVMNSLDLLTAKNLWNQAQVQALNAKYEYVFRVLIIDFYKGNQLKL
jgi:outer membrane protein